MYKLSKYYSLDECTERKLLKKKLSKFESDGKIEFEFDGDILKLTDLDLDEDEIDTLIGLFDKYDVYAYPDYEDGFDYYEDYESID